ncbi:NAD(P)-dependent oxidoreductase [Acidisoma cellulosilytica]|uniref:NAD(P)-dependent oxidoreductase n=1 Tax=Acidisoma cellulosilyticum TaxID=2802395 RepID=A0A963Z2N5_9PROT|nr:NAD(P)-dependent oxidoreductase [Acidisoma cellulosilyticum]MCB8881496.1 NAD(P)-dependent oxidoreductase [Acidisoma cellulosilyticum]
MSVGWIGLGKMGAPMSRHIGAAGHQLHVYDISPEATAIAAAAGAEVALSPEAVAAAAPITFLSIPNDGVLRSLVLGDQGLARRMAPDSILVETSTVSPRVSAEVGIALAAAGIHYLRSPLSGSTATAEAGKLTVLASGAEAAYRIVEPLLETFSIRRFYLGTGEEARYLKLAINMLVGATSALLAEALTFGRKGNLTTEQMLEVICESAVASPLIAYKRDMLTSRDFTPAFTVEQMIKDFDLVLDAASSEQVPVFLISLIRQQYEVARAQGSGLKDFFVLLEQYEAQAGLPLA